MFSKDSSGEYLEEHLKGGATLKYRKKRVLGKGGFAKCYQITQEASKKRYACKVIDREMLNHNLLRQKLRTEIDIQRKLSHKNVVKFERVFEDQKYIYIVLELCSNNTLNQLLKRRRVISEVETRYYTLQILQALLYIHNSKIVHRDLKLENFFISDNLQLKVGDFGLAARLGQSNKRKTMCGTPNFIAPQVLESKDGYGYEVDVWSLGITVYLLLYGHYPFEKGDSKSISSKINNKTYLINPSLSDISKSFVSRMLQVRPQERWTVKQLLAHQFLNYFQIPKELPRSCLACPLNQNFLAQFKTKRVGKLQLSKEDEEFNFMLQSRQSPSSPKNRKSTVSQSMSASKMLQLNKNQNLPYIFSQKKVGSFHFDEEGKNSLQIKEWLVQWWQNPQYGLLYQSNDGTVGFRFNDDTNIKAYPFPHKLTFLSQFGKQKSLSMKSLKTKESKGLLSKLKVMNSLMQKVGVRGEQRKQAGIFVRMYINTLTMFIVWLSNGHLQCRFDDKSELIIGNKHCMFMSSGKIKVIFESNSLMGQNQQIQQKQKRLANYLLKVKPYPQEQNQKQNKAPN